MSKENSRRSARIKVHEVREAKEDLYTSKIDRRRPYVFSLQVILDQIRTIMFPSLTQNINEVPLFNVPVPKCEVIRIAWESVPLLTVERHPEVMSVGSQNTSAALKRAQILDAHVSAQALHPPNNI